MDEKSHMTSDINTERKSIALVVGTIFIVGLAIFFVFRYGERWLRNLLIYLSQSSQARSVISGMPYMQGVARRFVAGETMDEAMAATRALNSNGMFVTLDYLGERVTDKKLALSSCREIVNLIDRIEAAGVEANVSVKLSQLGLGIHRDIALENLLQIVSRAKDNNNRIRIDMEESKLVDTTLDIYRTVRDEYGYNNVGVVIQSYLYRSEKDVAKLIEEGAWVRLCKGAYAEPPEIAYPIKKDTDANFVKLTQMLLSETARKNGVYLGVATHDEAMITATQEIARREQIDSQDYEFQMLYGIRSELQESLISQGYQLRVYVPYGTAWYPYYVRRLAERPANIWFFISNLFR
jgi:proline dehydrogenase